jgi:hypothetical protein
VYSDWSSFRAKIFRGLSLTNTIKLNQKKEKNSLTAKHVILFANIYSWHIEFSLITTVEELIYTYSQMSHRYRVQLMQVRVGCHGRPTWIIHPAVKPVYSDWKTLDSQHPFEYLSVCPGLLFIFIQCTSRYNDGASLETCTQHWILTENKTSTFPVCWQTMQSVLPWQNHEL